MNINCSPLFLPEKMYSDIKKYKKKTLKPSKNLVGFFCYIFFLGCWLEY